MTLTRSSITRATKVAGTIGIGIIMLLPVVPLVSLAVVPPGLVAVGILRAELPDSCLYLETDFFDHPIGIDNIGAFHVGDTVVVAGPRPTQMPDLQCFLEWWMSGNLIVALHDSVSLGCGYLIADNCYKFESFEYGTLDLERWHGFTDGDTVSVRAVSTYPFHCEIGQWDQSFSAVTVQACADTGSSVLRTTWGALRARFR
jgi:hypothetical protein